MGPARINKTDFGWLWLNKQMLKVPQTLSTGITSVQFVYKSGVYYNLNLKYKY